uniref:Uncharacterized protein n=1 Tax=Anguilla anguilla TaxID=7936 RepID=A0A0E9XEN4_ANGAN
MIVMEDVINSRSYVQFSKNVPLSRKGVFSDDGA